MKKCIVIAILDFNLLTNTDKFHSKFHFREDEDNSLLTDIAGIEVLEMCKIQEKLVLDMEEVEKWLYYLKNAGDESKVLKIEEIIKESEAIKMADEMLREVSADEHMRAVLLSREKFERDRKSEIIYAKQEGWQDGIKKTAKGLLILGIDVETIKKATGLTLEEINKLNQ